MNIVRHSVIVTGTPWREIASAPLGDIIRCARCHGRLDERSEKELACGGCGQRYPVTDGIPQLFVPNDWDHPRPDVTDVVKAFYEETPFPNYDDLDSRESLRKKARLGVFARLLDEQLPPDVTVLEVGCGTGQLTNFLGINWRRRAIGADLCMNSLRLAKEFRDRFAIVNADFVQMNLFRPPFADASMDVVISNGVLHHTSDPEAGFRAIAAKVKPGGYVLVGLYNWLGRLPTLWRRRLIEMFGDRMAALDARLRRGELNIGRQSAWFRDQYQHPHESRHSMDEVLRWFERNGIEFISSIPSIGDVDFQEDEPIFTSRGPGHRLDRLSSEIEMLLSGGTDGGLFIMIGRRVG
jgi:SAM-dependent methyltransferase